MRIPLRVSPLLIVILIVVPWLGTQAQSQAGVAPPEQVAENSLEKQPGSQQEIAIPGPLRSFLRMAGISQKVSTDEVLPLLARNVYVQGYIGWQDKGTPTEFLVLLRRYVSQAKELAELAGSSATIHVSNCDEALPLLRILGYRLRGTCGQPNLALVTEDSERAFVTIDSGFPLTQLEQALQHNTPFSYPFAATQVPILFSVADWNVLLKTHKGDNRDFFGLILNRPTVARLYWALSRIDPETRNILAQSVGLKKLLPAVSDLDFYGNNIFIRAGRVQVPGAHEAEPGWHDLVGANPDSPAEFVPKLLTKDNGWLSAYFDALSRINQEQQRHFIEGHRLKNYYEAFRGSDVSSDAARPAFRRAPDLLLLFTRLQWAADGQPMIPGGLATWGEILRDKNTSRYLRSVNKRAKQWNNPDQLVQVMFALTRMESDVSPLQMFLLFTEMERQRAPNHHLSGDTFRKLAKRFDQYSDQYLIFSEFPELDDTSISSFVETADFIDKISNHTLRGNAMGTFQADIGIWQVLARQQQIPSEKLNQSWQEAVRPFTKIGSAAQLFDAGCDSLRAVLRGAGNANASQDEIIKLLAGPRQADAEDRRVHEEVAKQIRSVMDGQRLVSLDTLFVLGKGLSEDANASVPRSSLISLAGELREFEMPRAIFTSSERTEWAAGIYNNRHTDLQMQTDLSKVLKSSPSRAQMEDARGQLAPFLRDTLVGLNYAYYAPPGAQMLHVNPLFVRSHDFAGETVAGVEGLWRAPQLFGEGTPAGGGAHFVGSLADLPYALSQAEQDFIAPENVQALIWREAVPGLLTNGVLPRWWNVSRNELHTIALYQMAGEELLSASATNQELRKKVISILSDRMAPERCSWLEDVLRSGQTQELGSSITPADTLYLTSEFRRRFPDDGASFGPSGQELVRLLGKYPDELSWERLSRDFGVPHKTLAQTYGRELLNVRQFPAASGYSSRLMAESWDSNNLYWARLADELGYSPASLNRLVPELTRRMVGKIFATEFEDWRALLRAMHETGEELRQGKIAVLPATRAEVGAPPLH
jgi:hypothetical protein